TGNGAISGGDASLISQRAVGLSVPRIPDLPTGITPPPAGGPDPRLYLVGGPARRGETITVELRIEATEPTGMSPSAGDYAIRFDASRLQVSNVRTGTLATGFTTVASVDNDGGTIRIAQYSAQLLDLSKGTDGVLILFDVTVLENARPGATVL